MPSCGRAPFPPPDEKVCHEAAVKAAEIHEVHAWSRRLSASLAAASCDRSALDVPSCGLWR